MKIFILQHAVWYGVCLVQKTSMPKDERNYGRAFENDAFNPKTMILP